MQIHQGASGQPAVLEGPPGTPLLQTRADVVTLIGTCFEEGARAVLLYPENLPPAFFDLSSGDAGEILQKLRNYRIRLAVVEAPGRAPHSAAFQALMLEENRGNDFRTFTDRAVALAWLRDAAPGAPR
jgi:hypothetical protein